MTVSLKIDTKSSTHASWLSQNLTWNPKVQPLPYTIGAINQNTTPGPQFPHLARVSL